MLGELCPLRSLHRDALEGRFTIPTNPDVPSLAPDFSTFVSVAASVPQRHKGVRRRGVALL